MGKKPVEASLISSEEETRFGWGRFRPACLQWLNKPQWFLFWLAMFSFFQALSVNGMTGLTIPSLEKRFQFSSKQTGLIAASNDISGIILVSFASFCGGYGNKIKWLGYGSFVTGFGSLVYVLPHLLAGPYNPPSKLEFQSNTETCVINKTMEGNLDEMCDDSKSYYNVLYLLIFMIAQLIMGAGTSPLYTLGPAYLDENVHPKSMPMYLAVWFVTTVLGPALGFIAGGLILKLYVDIQLPVGLNITPEDPRWIGAWWLGFFVGGCALILTAVIILGFPRVMPGSREMRAEAIKEGIIPPENDEIKASLKELPRATKLLLVNKTFVCTSLGLTIGALFGLGIGPFFTKILIIKFGITMTEAGIGVGTSLFPGMAAGILLGGYIVRRLNLKASTKKAALACAVLQFLGITAGLMMLIPGCNDMQLAGISMPYTNSSTVLPYPGSDDQLEYLVDKCNAGCSCSETQFAPVCGSDKITYFGACQAGCKEKISETSYANCTCIKAPKIKSFNSSTSESSIFGTAVGGICDRNCKNFKLFLFAMFIQIILIFVTAIPQKTVTLRCVPDNLRAYGLGLQFVFMRTLGSLPGPILFGSVMDSYCTLWKKECGSKGNCMNYAINTLSEMLATVGSSVQVVSCFFFFLAWYFYKQPEDNKRRYSILNEAEFLVISKETCV